MKTVSIAPMVLIIATGCSGGTRANECEPSLPTEPSPPTELTIVAIDNPPSEPDGCPTGEIAAPFVTMEGEVFLWHVAAPCKRRIRSKTDPYPYEWMATGTPCGSGVFFPRTPAKKCYMRGLFNEVVEVVNSPNGYEQAILDRAGWRNCSGEKYEQFLSAPECP